MTWKPKIEQLRPYVLAECRDIPPDLVLSIIQRESGGTPGIAGAGHTKPGVLYDVDGNPVEYSQALGLMQTIPATIASYNTGREGTKEFATVEDMTGSDERAIRLQIRIGCRYLAVANRLLHESYASVCPESSLADASDDQISLALTGYAVGAGATLKKMEAAAQSGKTPTFATLKKIFPSWGQNSDGKWINRPLKYADDVMTNYRANRSGSYTGTKIKDLALRAKNSVVEHKGGFLALAVFLTAAGWAVNRYYMWRREK